MLTNNFKQLLKTIASGAGKVHTGLMVKDYTGAEFELSSVYDNITSLFFGNLVYNGNQLLFESSGIKLGSGTTPVSRDDYTLETIDSGLWVGVTTFSGIDDDTGKCYVRKVLRVNNTSSNPITISEIGVYREIRVWSGNSITGSSFLLDRTLLSSPVTLARGETCAITYTLLNRFDV